MIELNTGVPGAGKTLSMVQELAKLQKRWEKHPDEARPVFVLGIPELALPHSPVPLKSVQVDKAGAPRLVPDWDEMPDGALVLIDECQGVFPPRSSQSTPPAHVGWLNTHRHHGFDLWITTQQPKLIDASVRALVGRHKHFRRMFGMQRSTVYEWDACSDSLGGMNNAVKTYWPFPAEAFKWYKSAEVHTKQRFKKPLWLAILPLGVALCAYFFPKAYSAIMNPQSAAKSPQAAPAGNGQVAAIAATPPGSQLVGYFRMGQQCYGIRKGGEVVQEPDKCRENLK
ncbi:zonular occludens toxin domain-containing protein [Massilia varians]|uniref:zonular occludens toxin domain-containing protein n=1 Tax=Massilia varians TaxID=457921 RepID=UPI002552741B|nr:zonular occludens toxin domain-containing protein [Massilia varians]MDK6078353.1 zonular occludens toxin domain-containing protein [Massilia varians]